MIIRPADHHTRAVFALLTKRPWQAPRWEDETLVRGQLSVRAAHTCKKVGVVRWEDLRHVTIADLVSTQNTGKVTIAEIKEEAAKRGVEIGSAISPEQRDRVKATRPDATAMRDAMRPQEGGGFR